jgi:hypothetical protein
MEPLAILVVVLAVAAFVSAPLRVRGGAGADAGDRADEAALADLEAAKEAKYREIRDADLDHRTGKLSDEDHRTLDAELRAEAIELLRRIDAVRGRAGTRTRAVG